MIILVQLLILLIWNQTMQLGKLLLQSVNLLCCQPNCNYTQCFNTSISCASIILVYSEFCCANRYTGSLEHRHTRCVHNDNIFTAVHVNWFDHVQLISTCLWLWQQWALTAFVLWVLTCWWWASICTSSAHFQEFRLLRTHLACKYSEMMHTYCK